MEFTINEPKFWPVSRSSHYSDRRSPATANARSRQSSHWLGLETGHTKGGLNTKLSAIVDLNGSAIALALESGPRADVKAATKELLGVLRVGDCLIGGKGCDSDALRAELLKMG
ncbi:MAG: hypothetical protein CMO80_19650, partial [Verrucomicrobiales bacterium]|nr:hypothetical protein [Verrucomicrobiales bacterium]